MSDGQEPSGGEHRALSAHLHQRSADQLCLPQFAVKNKECKDKTKMFCMDEIMPKLYLGGILIFDPAALKQARITHILSLMDRPLPAELLAGFTYKHVFALDLYDHDLLQDLDDCLFFVEEGRQQGAVLVHCQAGASRSATVVIAYLMRTNSMSKEAALEFVKSRRSIVSPNAGFLQQLELFEMMGCKVDQAHEEYRHYILSKVAIRSKSDFHKKGLPSSIYRSESSALATADAVYKCRKCRRVLFYSSALMSHMKGQGESAFDWRSKMPASQRPQRVSNDMSEENGDGDVAAKEEKCEESLFVEPIEWMKGQVEIVEGKLGCPKCDSKLGSFVWYGERCPCGAWVAPAFHIQKSKVDAMKPRVLPTQQIPTQVPAAQLPASQKTTPVSASPPDVAASGD